MLLNEAQERNVSGRGGNSTHRRPDLLILRQNATEEPGGVASYNGVRRYVPSYHTACSHDGPLANGDPAKDRRIAPDRGPPLHHCGLANPVVATFDLPGDCRRA